MATKKPKRDPAVLERFLKKEGLTKIPKGKESGLRLRRLALELQFPLQRLTEL